MMLLFLKTDSSIFVCIKPKESDLMKYDCVIKNLDLTGCSGHSQDGFNFSKLHEYLALLCCVCLLMHLYIYICMVWTNVLYVVECVGRFVC